ncbi:sensor histidine kinase [Globicatella sanguinis]|uniref:sensor histidine kinase n=1 Tax=Globicatella sanguinis TaxID=13076 RepID=UPI002542BE09|nr:HAMP domain-containing sensor histidine kinase [Globicatella sanguinis]MDK7631539.1 HAMP domain-containing sensor histidine kinase [Globicatella sanguinis]WIK65505.1 HAMP domain-containing sensor histidine kinase [Globicatella sanguinis]WKT54910.1 HAMP domain-containing sensor histidine kinase [Globicatella sanguinis]
MPIGMYGEEEMTAYEYFKLTPAKLELAKQSFAVVIIFLGIGLAYWQMKRKISTIHLNHLLEYLTYIARGNYQLRIPDMQVDELSEIVRSVNSLVDSTVHAMEEERRIEKTKDELIANVGHDLRTPLTSIIGYLGLIENKRYHSEEQLLEYTHIAYKKAMSMQVMVNDLFDYAASRLVSYEVTPEEVHLNFFFEQLAAEFELEAAEKNIEIEINVMPKNLIVHFDPEKMARVFNNLLSNALKYGHGATKIKMNANQIDDDDQIIMDVVNNGELLKLEELEKVFQRSYRADTSRNSAIPGTGLGLGIARNIVELHNGIIYAMIENNEMIFRIEMSRL